MVLYLLVRQSDFLLFHGFLPICYISEFISECSLGGGTCDKVDSCGGPHSTDGCSHSLNDVCCFDEVTINVCATSCNHIDMI